MHEETKPSAGAREDLQDRILARSVPWQRTCRMVESLLPAPGDGRQVVVWARQDAVGLTEAFARRVGRRGGNWVSAEVPAASLASGRGADAPGAVAPYRLPAGDEAVDVLLLVNVMEHVPDDRALVAECHRVLKPGGRLVLVVRQARTWTLLRPLRRLFGVADQARGRARPGYGESALFGVLKDGFDVEEARPYLRFFTMLVDIPVQRALRFSGIAREAATAKVPDDERVLMAYRRAARSVAVLYPLAVFASLLDLLLMASRGHALAISARRRQWRPRRAPTLKDGRSIAEATINTKIGTAAPF